MADRMEACKQNGPGSDLEPLSSKCVGGLDCAKDVAARNHRRKQNNNYHVFGTVELPDKPIMLPPFVEATHCLGYHLTRKGRAVADRVVSVLGYACPDITYSPSLYPITAALLHFMPVFIKWTLL
ncbi:TBC1 domain family member 24 [Operophtera brumata]|uniref:TBC1 domain family member 24 n=1 Tax=Operophtera brumata TaxID=104452 RepID=A0A0L7LCZ9_OPEBR|nr:TBC1 domain family member 24 [Operophtera brumata]